MSGLTPAPDGYPIKLVRDLTPTIINFSGEPGELWYAPVPEGEMEHYLRLKLAEEVAEYLVEDGGPDELADVYAVLRALENLHGCDLAAMAAADPRGGYLAGVMMYGRHDEFDRA